MDDAGIILTNLCCREPMIELVHLEGRNPLRPPIGDNRDIGYPAAPKDWRPAVAADSKGS